MAVPMKSVKNWRTWLQPNGPNTALVNLGDCINQEDLANPGGGIASLSRCWAADGSGYITRGTTRTPPEIATTTITEEVTEAKSTLEKVKEGGCGVPLYVVGALCPPLDVFTNQNVVFFYEEAVLGDQSVANTTRKDEEEFTMNGFTVSMMPSMQTARKLQGGRQTLAENTAINDVHFGNPRKCADDCGEAQSLCTVGILCSDSPAASPATSGDVWYTTDEGVTWTLCAAQPFAGAEDVISGLIFPISADTYRILVARSADGAAAMEVAYSDDWGATWSTVVVGSVVGLGANREGALHMLNPYHIWLALDTGYVYFSGDFGATWTRQTGGAGSPSAADLNEVWFSDAENGMAVGDGDVVLITSDGGDSWSLASATGSGNALLCVSENGGGGIWWVGDDGGDAYYSSDHGTTWAQRAFSGDGVGEVKDIEFENSLVGFMIHDTAAPVGSLLRTIDGGYNWVTFTDVTNAGLNSLHACSVGACHVVGEPSGGTGVALKYTDSD